MLRVEARSVQKASDVGDVDAELAPHAMGNELARGDETTDGLGRDAKIVRDFVQGEEPTAIRPTHPTPRGAR